MVAVCRSKALEASSQEKVRLILVKDYNCQRYHHHCHCHPGQEEVNTRMMTEHFMIRMFYRFMQPRKTKNLIIIVVSRNSEIIIILSVHSRWLWKKETPCVQDPCLKQLILNHMNTAAALKYRSFTENKQDMC